MSADSPATVPAVIGDVIAAAHRIVVLSGAGMSAESGMPTFRDAGTGLWSQYDPMTLATPEAFSHAPDVVWAWYLWRMHLVRTCQPNAGHVAIAELAEHREVSVVTQNVDDLHERAGSRDVIHLHGTLEALRCSACDSPHRAPLQIPAEQRPSVDPPQCHQCGGAVRPGVVWFGEMLPTASFMRAEQLAQTADLALVVGTSGLVFPAAGLPALARGAGVTVVEINPQHTPVSDVCQHSWRSTAAAALPALARLVRASGAG